MKNAKAFRNIKVFAVNNNNNPGFNIFLDFSGRHEFLMHHRHNSLLFSLLRNGVTLNDLLRWKHDKLLSRQALNKMVGMTTYLKKVIDEYVVERMEYLAVLNMKHTKNLRPGDWQFKRSIVTSENKTRQRNRKYRERGNWAA